MEIGSPGPDGAAGADELFDRLFRRHRANAVLAWLLVGVFAVAAVESLLDGDVAGVLFPAAVAGVVLVPPVAAREWRAMLPWEVLALVSLPVSVSVLFGGTLGTFATYLSVAGVALVVTVELHRFTALRVTHLFAVLLVVLFTLATVAVWTVVRWTLDGTFGTTYLTTNEALMVEWLRVTLAGLTAGVVFDAYFKRRDRWVGRLLRRVVRR